LDGIAILKMGASRKAEQHDENRNDPVEQVSHLKKSL
jgi:hypothetical protein